MENLLELIAFFCLLVCSGYCYLIFRLKKRVVWHTGPNTGFFSGKAAVDVCLVVPFRNERNRIGNLLESLSKQGRFFDIDIFFVDDHSDDLTADLIERWSQNTGQKNIHLRKLPPGVSGKISALCLASMESTAEWVLQVDADVFFNPNFLEAWSSYSQSLSAEVNLVPGLVLPGKSNGSFAANLSDVEQSMLAGITLGSASQNKPILCSGANLLLRRKWYLEQHPNLLALNKASGHDMFLLQYALPNSVSANHIFDCVSYTPSPGTFREYFIQRKRWSEKILELQIPGLNLFAFLTFLSAVSVLFLFCLALIYPLSILFSALGIGLVFYTNVAFYKRVISSVDAKVSWLQLFLTQCMYPLVVLFILLVPQQKTGKKHYPGYST